MKKERFSNKNGFSLTEVVIMTAIFSVIIIAVVNFGQSIFEFNRNAEGNLKAQTDARRVLKTIVSELRTVSQSSLGAYPISVAGTSSLVFFSNIDADSYKEKVRYFLQNGDLWKGIIKPSGNPLVYVNGSEVTSLLIKSIANGTTPIFEYYDKNYNGTSSPLAIPVQPTDVRLVKINIIIDEDPNKYPGPINVTSEVTLRNLKDNL